MKMQVKKEGVLIPKEMLEGIEEVEVVKEDGRITVFPVPAKSDPIFNLGSNPVSNLPSDASESHDKYLYGKK